MVPWIPLRISGCGEMIWKHDWFSLSSSLICHSTFIADCQLICGAMIMGVISEHYFMASSATFLDLVQKMMLVLIYPMTRKPKERNLTIVKTRTFAGIDVHHGCSIQQASNFSGFNDAFNVCHVTSTSLIENTNFVPKTMSAL